MGLVMAAGTDGEMEVPCVEQEATTLGEIQE